MFEQLKKNWQGFLEAPPGKRFLRNYRQRKKEQNSLFSRLLFLGGGVLIVIAGIFFLPAPGPGTIIIFIGLGLIAQESLWLSMVLDKTEVFIRKAYDWSVKKWGKTSIFVKGMIIVGIIIVAGLIAYGGYAYFFK